MVGICIVSSCGKAASNCCGSCRMVRYCSVECQKEDWKKIHKKKECVSMKKLASAPLTQDEISDVADKISCICDRHMSIGETKSSIDLYEECLAFARDRLGRLCCDVKINHPIICRLLVNLGEVYFEVACSSETDSHCISYLSEARELLVKRKNGGMNESEMWQLLSTCDQKNCQLYMQ